MRTHTHTCLQAAAYVHRYLSLGQAVFQEAAANPAQGKHSGSEVLSCLQRVKIQFLAVASHIRSVILIPGSQEVPRHLHWSCSIKLISCCCCYCHCLRPPSMQWIMLMSGWVCVSACVCLASLPWLQRRLRRDKHADYFIVNAWAQYRWWSKGGFAQRDL